MKLKISRFDDVPETVDGVAHWRLGTRETLTVVMKDGRQILYAGSSWTRMEEIPEEGDQ